jgi:hypothetical protein
MQADEIRTNGRPTKGGHPAGLCDLTLITALKVAVYYEILQRILACSCGYGNEHSDFTKQDGFLD